MSPTNVIAYARLVLISAVGIWVLIQLWTKDGAGVTVGATALAVGAAIDKLFGILESKKTADAKDVEDIKDELNLK